VSAPLATRDATNTRGPAPKGVLSAAMSPGLIYIFGKMAHEFKKLARLTMNSPHLRVRMV
jgi:hypothetical protein